LRWLCYCRLSLSQFDCDYVEVVWMLSQFDCDYVEVVWMLSQLDCDWVAVVWMLSQFDRDWVDVVCSEICADRTLNVFLQDPSKQHSVNSVLVSSGWAQATGVG